MKLHTNLTGTEVRAALDRAKTRGLITADVHFVTWNESVSSRTHPHGIDVQLGTYDKHSLPPGTKDQHGHKMHVRKYKNTGNRGANSDSAWAGNDGIWAATWHEWGWFITEVFAADPAARFGSDPARCARPEYAWGYASPADFHARTGYQFTGLPPLPPAHQVVQPRYAPGPAADPAVFGPVLVSQATILEVAAVGREWPDGVHTCAELQVLEPGRRPCTCGRCPTPDRSE